MVFSWRHKRFREKVYQYFLDTNRFTPLKKKEKPGS